MPKVQIDQPAPDFILDDFNGTPYKLSTRRGHSHVILVFNRGFA